MKYLHRVVFGGQTDYLYVLMIFNTMSCVSKVILTVESVQHYRSTDLLDFELVRIFDRYPYRYVSICKDRNTTYRARSIDFSSRSRRTVAPSHRRTVAPSHRNVAPRASGRTGTFDLHGV